jgi:hypothetical protein
VKYPAPPVVQLVPKHGLKDCIVASMASYLCKPYEEVVAAASRAYPNFWRHGLENKHAATIARRLKCPVRWARDYDDDSGVLSINYVVGKSEHAVLLLEGKIVELEDKAVTFWEPSAYLATFGARAGLLIVKK